jgi:phage shock protein E
MKYTFLTIMLLISVSVFSQKKEIANPDGAVLLDAASFKEKMKAEPNAVLIDVRTPGEVNAGYIPGAIAIDYNAPDFAKKISELDKSKTYFVYCKAGGRSGKSAELMKSTGFKHVHDLQGGYTAWAEKGFETTKPK